jgi:MurNAc alpha-1-phosphate uridylyltransferase
MKAMILAAGFGTRLKPLTDNLPKALVEFKSQPMLVHQIKRLKEAGISEIIINVHHHPDKIREYIGKNDFGIGIKLSMESGEILGTGGGILNAEEYFSDDDYFAVINVDIDTNFDVKELIDFTLREKPFAALAVQKRQTKRGLVFDDDMVMTGLQKDDSPTDSVYAFNCMHVISGEIFKPGLEVKFTGIFDIYIQMISKGMKILGYDTGDRFFKDLGKIENLK